MTVAVIIPCYREKLERVADTVASARAAAGVGRVIVVDDGYGDTALDSIEDVEVIHLPENRGCSGALNAGISLLSDDDVACRLDVGDHFYPDAKARQIEVVTSGRARCSSSPHFDPVSGERWTVPLDWRDRIFADSVFVPCTNVYRVSVWRQVGGHDEGLRYKADWDFSMKVEAYVGWHMHAEVTCSAGMFPDGFTAQALQDPVKRVVRDTCNRIVSDRGQALMHPDAFGHLFSEKWCARHGIAPMRRPVKR
jgi:glycosyltransferase involved in cell wall biosynthesis